MENMSWDLGDGKNIKFWKDTWSTFKQPINSQINYTMNINEEDTTVSQFIKNGTWDLGTLSYVLSRSITIPSMPLLFQTKMV